MEVFQKTVKEGCDVYKKKLLQATLFVEKPNYNGGVDYLTIVFFCLFGHLSFI